jgi:hypothetical protein
MNFKTTIVLIVLLVVVGGALWWTGRTSPPAQPVQAPSVDQGAPLLDVKTNNVDALSITDANGKTTTLKKYGDAWRLTAPVDAPAVDWSTRELVRSVAELRSAGRPAEAPDAGLSSPRYRLTLATDDGKTVNISIGNRAGPDLMYAQVDGGDVNLVDASLEKTLKTAAQDLRDKHLLSVKDFDVKQFRYSYGGHQVAAQRDGMKWKIIEPTQMPGDDSAISSLLSAITGAEATQYLQGDSDELAFAGFTHPTYTVWLSTEAPTTRSATTEPATTEPANPTGGLTLIVGASDSLANDHYFVQLPDGQAAKIAKETLDGMEKPALDLRDKDVVNIATEDVKLISVRKETWPAPTTQPASRPAGQPVASIAPSSTKLVVLSLRPAPKPPALGPLVPTTGPATEPTTMAAATQPSTKPAEQLSIWQFESPYDSKMQVDDSKVTALLGKLQPLQADKYLEKAPDAPPLDRYTVVILEAAGKGTKGETSIELVRPSNGGNPYGVYNGLTFEVSSAVLDALDGDFRKTPG